MTKEYEYYYQIDYIDADGIASYIQTYHNKEQAISELLILNHANRCLNADTKFVLDAYRYIFGEDDSDEVIAYNITDAETVNEHIKKVEMEIKNGSTNR